MARKRSRFADDDDDYIHDDDDRPRRKRRTETESTGIGMFLGIAFGVGVMIVVVAVVLIASSGKDDDTAKEPTDPPTQSPTQPTRPVIRQPGPRNPTPPQPPPKMSKGENWPKAIGKWTRATTGPNDIDAPYLFEFRKDYTSTFTRLSNRDSSISHDAIVDVWVDEGEKLWLRLRVENGQYTFSFTMPKDGTLVLSSRGKDVVFTRAK